MQGWNDGNEEDDLFAEASRMALGRVFNSGGAQPNPNSNSQPASTNAFSAHAYGGNSSQQGQQPYGSMNQAGGGSYGSRDQGYEEPNAKRQRFPDQGVSDQWRGTSNQYQDYRSNGPAQINSAQRPTSSDVFMFSRPGAAQQPQQQQRQAMQQPANPLQSLLSNMGGLAGGQQAGAGGNNMLAMAQLLAMAAQPNSNFRNELQGLSGGGGNRELQLRLLQNNLQNMANRRVEGIQNRGGAGGGLGGNFGSNPNFGGTFGGGNSYSGNGNSYGANNFGNNASNSNSSLLSMLQQPEPAPAPIPEPEAPLPMMGDLLQQRQQAVEAQQEQVPAEPEPEEDKEEDILDKVGKISEKLRSMLGKNVTDRCG